TMRLYIGLGVSIGIWIVLGIYVFSEIKKTYNKKGIFTNRLLNFWYVLWAFHHIPVVLASLFGIWLIPVNRTLALTGGLIIFTVGVVILPMGMIEFRSLRRSTGQDISKLITTGIYRWSRNPQFIGWFLMLLGISIAGRSGFALALTIVFIAVLHLYTIRLAEPYLENLYGEEYCRYKSNTPKIHRDTERLCLRISPA
ncbi:MAG TPA: isoprenylcysteine carboxylmethyltransferase family protein, partial [Nitrospirae bacterium]|nr:isoprenylcysteine carboxylmethyltransferase family protein [Nitrospirota bacterium]